MTHPQIIVSGSLYTMESTVNEMITYQPSARMVKWLSNQSALMTLPDGMAALQDALHQQPPIYIQHISPVNRVIDYIEGTTVAALFQDVIDHVLSLGWTQPFAVQTTLFDGDLPCAASDINTFISDTLTNQGLVLDVRHPYHIISIAYHSKQFSIGLSTAKDNLSEWRLGIAHYSHTINRAEHKLDECIDFFHLTLPGRDALDIGAAPGGWTQTLVNRGYHVTAVDPGDMDPDIASHPHVQHLSITAQAFLHQQTATYDLIVNDMIMDCRESARIMLDFAGRIRPNGLGIITLKLPKQKYGKKLKSAVKILRTAYDLLGIRQLPSNKSELTVVVAPRTAKEGIQ